MSKLTGKKLEKRMDIRADRHEKIMEGPGERRHQHHKPGSQNMRKTGKA